MDVVCNTPTGNLNFLDMKIIKIKKKIKIFRTDGEFTHLTRSASLVDNNGIYCNNLHYCAIPNGLNYRFLLYQDCYIWFA